MSDSILQRIAHGNPSAVEESIDKFGGLVWSIARRLSGPEDAEDLVQEIFIELWRNAGRYDAKLASETTFVAMIARRRSIDHHRRSERRPTLVEFPETATEVPGGASRIEARADLRNVRDALERLRPEVRQVIELAVYQGLTHSEIAAQTGLPLGTVKSHARRGLEQVRATLGGTS